MKSTILNLIRCTSIGAIVLAHILEYLQHPWGAVGWLWLYRTGIGNVAVMVMIVLSGCCLALSTQKPIGWGKFMAKRLRRIYLMYWKCLGIAVITSLLLPWPKSHGWGDVLPSILGTHALMYSTTGPWLPTAWFIGLIVSLYALFPWLNKGMRTERKALLLLCFLVSTVTRMYFGTGLYLGIPPMKWFPLSRLFEFAAGVWLGQAIPSHWWRTLNGVKWVDLTLARLAAWSFPIFLLHTIPLDLLRAWQGL